MDVRDLAGLLSAGLKRTSVADGPVGVVPAYDTRDVNVAGNAVDAAGAYPGKFGLVSGAFARPNRAPFPHHPLGGLPTTVNNVV